MNLCLSILKRLRNESNFNKVYDEIKGFVILTEKNRTHLQNLRAVEDIQKMDITPLITKQFSEEDFLEDWIHGLC